VLHVNADGSLRDDQRRRDLAVGRTGTQQRGDLALSDAQPTRQCFWMVANCRGGECCEAALCPFKSGFACAAAQILLPLHASVQALETFLVENGPAGLQQERAD
jgi:hypothetical protein